MYLIPNAKAIRTKRDALGLSAYALAIRAGLDKKAIYRLEDGSTRRTSSLRLREIADVLGCQLEDICESPRKAV